MQQMVMCERCHRLRAVKYMERALYVRSTLDGPFLVTGQSETYRCLARSSCNTGLRRHAR
jgi:hypothetical protein